jgi:CRISPR/Cas system-associated exonuclease Cas4 (RecB family)
MKEAYHGQNLRAVAKVPEDWPDGIVDCSAAVEQVRSQEFQLARHPWVRFTITGRIDALVRFTDETFGVIDFKASRLEASKLQETYAMQLQAYAFALEHPAWGSTDDDDDDDDNHNNKDSPVASSEFGHPSVTQLALLAFRPERFEIKKHHQESHLCGYSELIPVERDDDGFYDLLRQIAEMMESPTPPEPSESCGACSFYAARYPFQS